MRINQLLTESEQQDLYEGPKFNKFGKAVGDIAGMAAKGVGAVAGGIAGAGSAIKKGFQSGKARVAQGGDSPDAVIDPQKRTRAKAAPVGGGAGGSSVDSSGRPVAGDTTAADTSTTGKKPGFIAGLKAGLAGKPTPGKEQPAAGGGAAPAGGGAAAPADNAAAVNAQGPKGTAPAKPQTGAAATAMKKTADATAGANAEKAGQTVYAQVKSQINNLDKKGKQRILQLLQKSLTQPSPADQKGAAGKPAAGAMGQMAGQLAKGGAAQPNTMANAPVSKTNTAKPGNPNAAPAAGVPGDDATPTSAEQNAADARVAAAGGSPEEVAAQRAAREKTVAARKPRNKKSAAAPAPQQSQAEIDAERERVMGPTSDSIIRKGNGLAETLMKAIAEEKRRMVAEGKISIFRVR